MEEQTNFVITINRQFGTGGHAIGEMLAKRLGVRFVDNEILHSAAHLLEIDKSAAEKLANKKPSWWDDFVKYCSSLSNSNPTENDSSKTSPTTRQLFYAQADIIKLMAESGSCIIIGRCAFDILKDMPNVFKVFLHSDEDFRLKRILENTDMTEKEAIKKMKELDKLRESYTKSYTGKDWWDARNYDLTLDVGRLGIEKTVDAVVEMAPKFITL